MNMTESSYISLSTKKRDGSWVNTPVWFAQESNILYLFSEGKAGKIKRLKNFSEVKICTCTVTGKITGEWQNGQATILEGPADEDIAYKALLKRFGWQMRIADYGAILARKKHKRAFIKVVLE